MRTVRGRDGRQDPVRQLLYGVPAGHVGNVDGLREVGEARGLVAPETLVAQEPGYEDERGVSYGHLTCCLSPAR